MLNKVLGRKRNNKNETFEYVYQNIELFVSKEHIAKVQAEIVSEIMREVKGKRIAIAYSGGKDSVVLNHMYNLAGYKNGIMGMTIGLEFTGYKEWVKENLPSGIEIIYSLQDLKWLVKNQSWALFPDNASKAERLRILEHRNAEEQYCRENDIEIMLYGRRIIDGNVCGKGEGKIYRVRGRLQYNPLKFWSHEEVLGYLRYMNLSLPPYYSFPNGWIEGYGSWNNTVVRQSISEAWDFIFTIEPEIVIKAAEYIKSAQDYLSGKEK